MSNFKSIDMLDLDDIFEMGGGYVLNFSDRTFARFFAEELNVDIDNDLYTADGRSKAKRLRCFLQMVDKPGAVKTLKALWDYREAMRERFGHPEKIKNAHGRLLQLIEKLEGRGVAPTPGPPGPVPVPARDSAKFAELKRAFLELTNLEPQPRGYAFEKFLTQLFNAHGLAARDPFRLRGEQIDGSLQLGNETYLLEAKWQNNPVGVAQLHGFHGKLEEKAAWTRGLFVSYAGFSEDGLHAWGRGKRVVCMDGLDLYEMLDREIPLNHVLDLKIRRAAETGRAFIGVRELFL